MSKRREEIAATIAAEVVTLAQSIVQENSVGINQKTGRNSLRNSNLLRQIKSITETSADDNIVIRTLFGNYIRYIERGRKPKQGKLPPIDALRDWALANNLPADNNTLWAIAHAIWRDGYAGRPILSLLEKEIDRQWSDRWAEELFRTLNDEIVRMFEEKITK